MTKSEGERGGEGGLDVIIVDQKNKIFQNRREVGVKVRGERESNSNNSPGSVVANNGVGDLEVVHQDLHQFPPN